MNNVTLRNITNHFQDVHLVRLASWRQANEFTPRDTRGPYMVSQEGYDRDDMKAIADEFVLGWSKQWLSLSQFFLMPMSDRRAEFVFGIEAEVMRTMGNLPSKAVTMRPGGEAQSAHITPDTDEMAVACQAGRNQTANQST